MHKRGRTNDFPKNGGSLDAMDDFLGECSSNVIIFGGVEIKLVDFGRSVVHFIKNGWGVKKFIEKFQNGGGAQKNNQCATFYQGKIRPIYRKIA